MRNDSSLRHGQLPSFHLGQPRTLCKTLTQMGSSCSVIASGAIKLSDRVDFEIMTRHCWSRSSTPEQCAALVSTIQTQFPGLYAEFLYRCHRVFRPRGERVLVGRKLIDGLAEINDHKFTLEMLREPSQSPRDDSLSFPVHCVNRSTIEHMFRVLEQANESPDRLIEASVWFYPSLVLSELFNLGERRSRKLNNRFFSPSIHNGVIHLCGLLATLGLPDSVLAEVVSHGVFLAATEVHCRFPHGEMVRLIVLWNVFQGDDSSASLAKLIGDLVGPSLPEDDKCKCHRRRAPNRWIRAESCWCMLPKNDPQMFEKSWFGVFVHFRREK